MPIRRLLNLIAFTAAFCLCFALAARAEAAAPCPWYVENLPPAPDYKTLRLREMADAWRCTDLEDRTIPLLAMLLTEDGMLSAERRGDCQTGDCRSIGMMQWHICRRGGLPGTVSQGRTFCRWKDGKSPLQQFEELHPRFSTDWTVQFGFYGAFVSGLTKAGWSADDIIHSWNRREAGRREKVRANERLVRAALGL